MKEKTNYDNQTYGTIMARYTTICGNYGKKIFEEKVLPEAFEYFNGDESLLIQEISKIIENAGECKTSEIDDYLSNIRFHKSASKPENKGKRSATTQDSLEKLVRKLEGWLIIYNEGK